MLRSVIFFPKGLPQLWCLFTLAVALDRVVPVGGHVDVRCRQA